MADWESVVRDLQKIPGQIERVMGAAMSRCVRLVESEARLNAPKSPTQAEINRRRRADKKIRSLVKKDKNRTTAQEERDRRKRAKQAKRDKKRERSVLLKMRKQDQAAAKRAKKRERREILAEKRRGRRARRRRK